MKIVYLDKTFRTRSRVLIVVCNQILEEFAAQGYELTLRQLYYQLVARDLFPDDRKFAWTGHRWVKDESGTKNAEPNYDMLGSLISDARLAGLVDWDAIVDRTRHVRSLSHWNSPSEIVKAVSEQFNYDLWAGQPTRVEVWIEKDALVDITAKACTKYDVPFFSCRGYTSQSEMWGAAQRIGGYYDDDPETERVVILHLGDHDPSGLDMTRDIEERLAMFCKGDGHKAPEINRIALNMPQVRKYNPPPNPAKLTDCRVQKYIENYGRESWELDALNPKVITDLIEKHILAELDEDLFNEEVARQNAARAELAKISANYSKVVERLNRPKKNAKAYHAD